MKYIEPTFARESGLLNEVSRGNYDDQLYTADQLAAKFAAPSKELRELLKQAKDENRKILVTWAMSPAGRYIERTKLL